MMMMQILACGTIYSDRSGRKASQKNANRNEKTGAEMKKPKIEKLKQFAIKKRMNSEG